MFLQIELNNFRSFDNIVLDLSENNKKAKNLAIIYGENGSGKTNLIASFVMLSELLDTMNIRDKYEWLLNRTAALPDEEIRKHIQEQLSVDMRNISSIIDDYKMVDSNAPISARYDFIIGGNTGSYYIELGEEEIIRERLEYKVNLRKGTLFDCSPEELNINPAIVKDKDFYSDICSTAKRYWGKHTLLAIVMHEIDDKSKAFGRDNLSYNFEDVLDEFSLISGKMSQGGKIWKRTRTPFRVLYSPIEGNIPLEDEKELDETEKMFSSFFSSIDSDVKKLFYKRIYNEKYISYKLFIERMLADTYRTIDFSRESNGNHQLLDLLCFFVTASFGGTVVLDEADSGIHDLLFKKIIQEVNEYIDGQIIMTTHNTMLMESEINKGSFYFITEQAGCHKQIKSISEYGKRTFLGNNIRNKYLNGDYDGLPKVEKISYKEILDFIANTINDLSD